MPLTGSVDTANARTDLFVDYSTETGTHTSATMTRHVGALTAAGEYVRDLTDELLLGEQAYVSDHEAPLDVAVYYSVVSDAGLVLTTGPFTIASNGFVWIKDPGRPWADLRLDLCLTPSRSEVPESCTELETAAAWVGFGDKTRAVDAGLFPVLNAELPADVYARRKGITSSAMFLTRTVAMITTVYDLFTVGGPVLIQVPTVYGMDAPYGQRDRYWQPADVEETYLSQDQRKTYRVWNTPITEVAVPVGEPQGTDTANWCAVKDTYATFADLTATGFTWGQIAAGEAVDVSPDSYGFGPYGSGPYGDGG